MGKKSRRQRPGKAAKKAADNVPEQTRVARINPEGLQAEAAYYRGMFTRL